MTAEAGFTRFTTRDFESPINAYYEVRPLREDSAGIAELDAMAEF